MKRYLVLAAIAATAVVLLPGTQKVAAGGSCAVVPTLRDSAVDQGVGGTTPAGYAPLVRGKDTLVRFYLSNPSCSSSQLQVLDVSLSATVANSDGTTRTIGPFAPVNPYAADRSANFPVVSSYTAAPVAADTTSDPRFVVPGYLLVASTTSAFRVTFNLTGHFRVGATGASTAFGPLATTGSFDRQSRALRVLVVKMGDPTGIPAGGSCPAGATCVPYPVNADGSVQHPEFDDGSVSVTQNALSTLERQLPLPSGASAGAAPTGDLAGANGGLRYTFNLASSCGSTVLTCGMLNLHAVLDANGTPLLGPLHHFCGSAGNFSSIQTQLTNMLNAWNVANPNATADRVLGVVAGSVSDGPNQGCAGGMAAFQGGQAWVRVDPSGDNVGAIASMELSHTFGDVPLSRSRTNSAYHSKFTEADNYVDSKGNVIDTNRAYNLLTRSYDTTDRTTMYPADTLWTNDSTVMEAADYGLARCQLGGATTSDCATSGTVGSTSGVAAGADFSIAGSVGPSAPTADVTESYFSLGASYPTPDPTATSTYHLVQRQGDAILHNDPLPVQCDVSDHDAGSVIVTPGPCYFAAAFDFDTSADRIELWRGAPPAGACSAAGTTAGNGSSCLYVRARHDQPSTTVTGGGVAPGALVDYTHSSDVYDNGPAMSPNGKYVAWVNGDDELIHVAPIDATDPEAGTATVPVPSGAQFDTGPAWSATGTRLAFAAGGSIYVVTVGLSGATPTFGTPLLVYDGATAGVGFAQHPTFSSKAGAQVAFETGSGIYIVDSNGTNAGSPTGPIAGGQDPSWSHTPGMNLIAYDRLVLVCPTPSACFNQRQVWTTAPTVGAEGTLFRVDAFHPSFGPDGRIAYELGGDIDAAPVAPDGSADLAGEVQLVQPGESTPPGFTESPSYTGSNLAFVGGDAGNLEDIWVESVSPTDVTITSTVAAGADANQLRLDLYYHCGGLNYPVSLGLRPDQVDGATATFHPIFDSSFACSGGTLLVFENDGFSRFDITSAGPIVALEGPDFPPVATINEARPGARFLQYAPIALQGAGKDPLDGELTGTALHWTITDPDGVQTDLGTGSSIDLPNAALPFNGDGGHGWKTGTYRVSLTATDAGGRSDTATSSITVVGDENDDGLADSAETACGVSTTDPAAAFGDVDGDGLPNIDDPRLCAVDPKQETTPPTITLSHTGSLVPSVTETVSASDLDGGLRSVSCTLDGDPVALPGEAALWASQTFSASFPVTGPGTHAVACTATDTAYNSANAAQNVALLYGFSGFLSPVDNPPTVNTGKAGRTYPVKFKLTDSTGQLIRDLSAVTDEKYKSVPCGAFSNDPSDALETTATGGSTLRFDGSQFVYNWQTPSAKGCYVLYVLLADGSVRQANFQLT